MNPTSVDIKDMLEGQSSLGLVFADNLFVGDEPDLPDNTVTIFDTPGGPPLLCYYETPIYDYTTIQVRVRNNSYLNGWDMINDIKNFLHGKDNEIVNNTDYQVIVCVGEPFLLDRDENNRFRFVVNFDVQRKST
jgi:hypothetical protein